MSIPDRIDGAQPGWQAAPPAIPAQVEPWDDGLDVGAPPAKSLNARVIWRAARRHWWQILLLWAALSGGLMYLAYHKIKTSYEAVALLNVKSSNPRIYDQSNTNSDFDRYQRTQVDLVTSSDVLADTLASHPELIQLPMLRGLGPGETETIIRKNLRVTIRPGTSLFTVALESEDRDEAVQIVDAVVESYLKAANNWASQESQEQVRRLKTEAEGLEKELQLKKDKLRGLVQSLQSVDPAILKDRERVSLERYQKFLSRRDEVMMRRIQLESALEVARLQAGQALAKAPPQQAARDQVARLFYNDPQVAEVGAQLKKARAILRRLEQQIKKRSDPSLAHAQGRVKELEQELDQLWKDRAPQLQQGVEQAGPADAAERSLQELEASLAATQAEQEQLKTELAQMNVDTRASGSGALEVSFAHAELDKDDRLLVAIKGRIQQLEFDMRGPAQVARANRNTQSDPSTNKRMKVMAATPVGVFCLVLGFFVLLEIRSGRVADPDDLPSRVRVEVLGVVPPLPSLRPTKALWGSRDELRARRQLEEFVQSLDHLRVALYSGRKGQDRRCVMITSACSSEGKTTLSAHLAGRCANAGLSTVVVDADLRNPSLSRLLKVPDGPGLTDVLRGETSAEAAMIAIEAGGGFHLLPAGTPGYDPSRLLEGEQLGQLLGQLRQAFDVVILDTPPVLLVADALTLGRWCDGALLAVRYDTSRFPQVERAHRRLSAVGVPVLGAVVNGVRTMDSSYSYYSYAYHAADRAPALGVDATAPAERAT